MKPTIVMPFAAFAVLLSFGGAALAASPAYCALYADEFLKHADGEGSVPPTLVHDRAYHKCLNSDDEPPLPAAYFDPAAESIGGPFLEEDSTKKATVDPEPTKKTPAKAKEPTSRVAYHLERWTPKWKAWCAAHFPNSFDPESGTVLPFNSNKRTAC